MNPIKSLMKNKKGSLATAAIGVTIVLIVGIIAAVIFFSISEQVPRTNDTANETIDQFVNYAKIAFGFIGLGAFVGAAFLIINIIRGGPGGV